VLKLCTKFERNIININISAPMPAGAALQTLLVTKAVSMVIHAYAWKAVILNNLRRSYCDLNI